MARSAEQQRAKSVTGVDGAETGVVIPGVETSFRLSNFFTSTDDAPRAAVTLARGGHGVLPIKAAWLARQQPLAVAKHHTVLLVAEGATSQDALVDILRLTRQGGQCHDSDVLTHRSRCLPNPVPGFVQMAVLPCPDAVWRCHKQTQAKENSHHKCLPGRSRARGARGGGVVFARGKAKEAGRVVSQCHQQSGEVSHAALHQSRYAKESARKAQGLIASWPWEMGPLAACLAACASTRLAGRSRSVRRSRRTRDHATLSREIPLT